MSASKLPETEEQLFQWIQSLVAEGADDDVPVPRVTDMVRKFGVNVLINLLEQPDKRGKKLLSNRVFMSLYTIVSKCSLEAANAPVLRRFCQEQLQMYLDAHVKRSVTAAQGVYLVDAMARAWERYQRFAEWMARMMRGLDNMERFKADAPPTVSQAAVRLFLSAVWLPLQQSMWQPLLELINRDRDGEIVDKSVIRHVIELYVLAGIFHGPKMLDKTTTFSEIREKVAQHWATEASEGYASYLRAFEGFFLESTSSYYGHMASQWILSDSIGTYLRQVNAVKAAETHRCDHYLSPKTLPKLITAVDHQLIVSQQQTLFDMRGCSVESLLANDRHPELELLYKAFESNVGPSALAARVQSYVIGEGKICIERKLQRAADAARRADNVGDPDYVSSLATLQRRIANTVRLCFNNDTVMQKALNTALSTVLAEHVGDVSNAEVIVSFCDDILTGRRAAQQVTTLTDEQALDSVVNLFEFMRDKDMFLEIYRRYLAQRLLNHSNVEMDSEKAMLSRFKMLCGGQHLIQMEGMLIDMNMAQEVALGFSKTWETNGGTFEFLATVLKSGTWPTLQPAPVLLPSILSAATTAFTAFYTSKHDGRMLHWIFSEGTVEMRAAFKAGSKILRVTTLQACCLLLFNARPSLSLDELVDGLGLPAETVKRVVHPMACIPNLHILTKSPDTTKIGPTDSFSFNDGFRHAKKVLKVPPPPLDKTKAVAATVQQDRRFAIDAAIVRIMKSRQRMEHSALVAEVLQHCSRLFRPEPGMVKSRIEDLISREYLERDTANRNVYKYMA